MSSVFSTEQRKSETSLKMYNQMIQHISMDLRAFFPNDAFPGMYYSCAHRLKR